MSHPALFKPGCQPGPGRPKGSVGGRARAVQLIDDLITKHADKLHDALEAELLKNPVKFWTRYGFPLVPQAMVARVESVPSCGPWVDLIEVCRLRDIEEKARAAGLDIPPPAPRLPPNTWPAPATDQEPPERDYPMPEEKPRPAFWPSPKPPPGANNVSGQVPKRDK